MTIKEPKIFYNKAFIQLSIIFSCFPVKFNQSQPAFFFGTEEVKDDLKIKILIILNKKLLSLNAGKFQL